MGRCRIPRPEDPEAAKRAEVVELLFAYVERLGEHFGRVAQSLDLTSVQAKLLLTLGEPGPMRCVAESLGCDPSNVTGVVDRLQERGLVAREEGSTDRRVKFLQLTAEGRRLRESLGAALFRDVPGMNALGVEQIEGLRDVLAALCGPEAARVNPRA